MIYNFYKYLKQIYKKEIYSEYIKMYISIFKHVHERKKCTVGTAVMIGFLVWNGACLGRKGSFALCFWRKTLLCLFWDERGHLGIQSSNAPVENI